MSGPINGIYGNLDDGMDKWMDEVIVLRHKDSKDHNYSSNLLQQLSLTLVICTLIHYVSVCLILHF